MKVGIVGGNSQVGTELGVLLQKQGIEVVPIVRNELSAAFFEVNDFSPRIGNITNEDDAGRLLSGLDAVVIAARAKLGTASVKRTVEISQTIVRNAAEYAPEDAAVVYLSSLVAFGRTVQKDVPTNAFYRREKRAGENLLADLCEGTSKTAYSLRLGHVIGDNQNWTAEIREAIWGRGPTHLDCPPDRASNVLHTVTLCEALQRCFEGAVSPGTYTCVNVPQWTWRDVFEYYAPDGERLVFQPTGSADGSSLFQSMLFRLIPDSDQFILKLVHLLQYAPERLNHYLWHQYLNNWAGNEISELHSDRTFSSHALKYEPVPGPFIPDLTPTEALLADTTGFGELVRTPES